jgi:hypothetical protein
VPTFELPLALHTPTLVEFDTPLEPPEALEAQGRLWLLRLDERRLLLMPTAELPEDERLLLTVRSPHGPVRLVLHSWGGFVAAGVRVVRALPETPGAEGLRALSFQHLAPPTELPLLAVPQQGGEASALNSRMEVVSLLREGPRLLVLLVSRSWKNGPAPRQPAQVRLRALRTGAPSWLEWVAPLHAGPPHIEQQLHIFTTQLPEGTSRLEVALDEGESLGAFSPLPLEKAEVRP